MTAKHTPGPWEWDGKVWLYDDANEAPWLVQSPSNSIKSKAVLAGQIICTEEANARLIAAAPELLNAVRVLLSNHDNRISKSDRDAAYAAIAKATGETA